MQQAQFINKMKPDKFIKGLRRIVGKNHVSNTGADAEIYSYDASLARGTPDAVVFPADTSEVSRVVSLAYSMGIPFVPRGYGTNLSGGTVLSSGGLVICLSRLNRILAIQADRRYAVVQAGVTNLELQDGLARFGFFYAPDPASQKVATFGGTVGENSGGPRCLKYGVTVNHVLGMEFVLPDGSVVKPGGAAIDPPGYDLRGIVTGSEGTFGIITEVTVRILPKSESVITMLAVYDEVSDAARSVSAIISAGIIPATLEMMDSLIINAVEDSNSCGYPRDAAAVLIIEVEGLSAGLKKQAGNIRDICMEEGCREIREAGDDGERNRLWEGRRGAFGAIARIAPGYLVNDCTVPRTRLPEALDRVEEIAKKYDFRHGNVFHAGDGNLHPLLFFDSRDPEQLSMVKKAGQEIMEACVELGGTISGEHGIGVEKIEAMRIIYSENDLDVHRALKSAFDPKNLLNPGKVIPESNREQTGESSNSHTYRKNPETRNIRKPEKEIISRIKEAFSRGRSVLPVGRGCHLNFGNTGENLTVNIDSSGCGNIHEFDPLNQVVTVGAGMGLADLQKELAAREQWLPIRPPFSHREFTVGGLVALGACGPERIYYGAPRDRLLGLRFINHKGCLISAGGRVVKNVAGYDITRLMAGSAGTLGFITEATFHVSLMPERNAAITGEGPLEACSAVAVEFNKSALQPVFTVLIPGSLASPGIESMNWSIYTGFEGFSKTVDYQLEKADVLLRRCGLKLSAPVDYSQTAGLFREYYIHLDQSSFIMRAAFPLNRLLHFADTLKHELKIAGMFMDFGCGIILAAFEDMDGATWERIGNLSLEGGGHAVLEKAPAEFKEKHDVFGPYRPEWEIVYRIKTALDPKNRFAPGRLPGKR